jgi:hypothetical protein
MAMDVEKSGHGSQATSIDDHIRSKILITHRHNPPRLDQDRLLGKTDLGRNNGNMAKKRFHKRTAIVMQIGTVSDKHNPKSQP